MSEIKNAAVLVFDVGGSHVSCAVCSGPEFQLGPVFKEHHPEEQTSEAFVDLLQRLGELASAGLRQLAGATLAMPSPFDFAAGVSLMRHKLPYLYGVDLRLALAQRFGWQPAEVSFVNDADAYLLGEIGAGAGRGFARVIGMTLGTGTGGGFAVNGKLVTEGPGVPRGGEIWDIPYEGGIVEDCLSTRAIEGGYQKRTGKACDVATIASAAAEDPAAQETFTEFGFHLGRVLGAILADFHPDAAVLGGGIAHASRLFLPAAQAELKGSNVQLRVSELWDRAPLVGCGVARFNSSSAVLPA